MTGIVVSVSLNKLYMHLNVRRFLKVKTTCFANFSVCSSIAVSIDEKSENSSRTVVLLTTPPPSENLLEMILCAIARVISSIYSELLSLSCISK